METLKALEQAVAYIESRLGEDIGVEDVAREVGYSYYHLTRLFQARLGESVGGYIRKRRLADGAKKLLYGRKRVVDIALESGFESHEAFSRAFRGVYRVSPAQYRKRGIDTVIGAKGALEPSLLRHIATSVTVKPEIVCVDEVLVAGIRGRSTLNDNIVPELWERFNRMWHMLPNPAPRGRGFGVCESQETLYTMNGDAVFHGFVGMEVLGFEGLPQGFLPKVVAGGKYAVFTHRGSLANLGKTYDYIWGTWFLEAREQLDCREDFEVYDERFLGFDDPRSEMDIYVPVR